MRSSCRVRLILICLCSGSLWAAFPGLRYLDEIGHLGTPGDPRTSVRLGRAEVVSSHDSVLFQGRDDDGKSWRAALPVFGGIGFTTVWQADFDHNSRPDLLIAAHFPGNGRCLDEVTLSFLLFNDRGRPVPWVIQTRMPYTSNFPPVPAIFTDINHNGLAELVVTDCTYSSPPRLGEDRRITGIYEAKDATWSLALPARLEPYTTLVRQSHRFRPQFDRLLAANPAHWSDQGNRLDEHGLPPVQLAAVLTGSEDCRVAIHLPPVVDGRLQTAGWKDPCDELGRDRIQLSNGTVCYGWPTVMLDDEDGREIVAESERPQPLLQKIIEQRSTVVLAGQKDPKRCIPILLWAFRAP
jgi:hypothetical protein